LAALALGRSSSAQPPPASQPGRYQIQAFEYHSILSSGNTGPEKFVFRIDTETGTVWKYMDLYNSKDNTSLDGWEQIPEKVTSKK
jgi:hypothetical protein